MTDLLAATAGRSVLLITHDLEGLDRFDEIVVLARGRMVERGVHTDLVVAGGIYQQMWCARSAAMRELVPGRRPRADHDARLVAATGRPSPPSDGFTREGSAT